MRSPLPSAAHPQLVWTIVQLAPHKLMPRKAEGAPGPSFTWVRGPGRACGRLFCWSTCLFFIFDSGASPQTVSTEPTGARTCFQSRHVGQRGRGPCWVGEVLVRLWNPSVCLDGGRVTGPLKSLLVVWSKWGLLTASLSLSLGFPHSLQSLFFFLSFHFFLFLS